MGDIAWWSRLVEGSPMIVLLLAGALVGGGRLAQGIIMELLRRLDRKDEAMHDLHQQTLVAVRDNTEALRDLTRAIETARR